MKNIFSVRQLVTVFCYLSACAVGWSQPVNQMINDLVIPSPTAGELGKYADIPVDYSSGVPHIAIPLYELREGPLRLPVSLSYHASGHKMAGLASWAGLGWSVNAGGMISRTVLGLPDEYAGGYKSVGQTLSDNPDNAISQLTEELKEVINGEIDSQPDLFAFNFNGYVGKFYIDYTQQKVYTIPAQDILINYDNSGGGGAFTFKAVTSDGTIYTFGTNGNKETTFLEQVSLTAGFQGPYESTYYLSKIESPDKLYKIDFTYVNETYRYSMPATCQYAKSYCGSGYSGGATTCSGIVHPLNTNTFVNYNTISGKRLSTIVGTNTTLTFEVGSTARSDLDPVTAGSTSKPYPLSAIRVNVGGSSYCKKWVLTTGYFTDPAISSSYYEGKRLQLQSVYEVSCATPLEQKPPYQFTYYGGNTMPHRLTKAIDHWGYYNAKTTNTAKLNVPATTPCSIFGTTAIGNSNRDATANSNVGTLQKVVYPTGGAEFFTYEPHTFFGTVNPPTQQIFHTLIAELPTYCGPGSGSDPACCPSDLDVSADKTSSVAISSGQVSDGGFILTLQANNPSWCTGTGASHYVYLTVKNQSGTTIWSGSLNTTSTGGTKTLNKTFASIGVTTAGTYSFNLLNYGRTYARLQLYDMVSSAGTNTIIGGIRIKKISRSKDAVESTDDIIRTFEYVKAGAPTESSAVIDGFPSYAQCGNVNAFKANAPYFAETAVQMFLVRDVSVAPLGNADGRHVTYSRVLEYFGEGATKTVNGWAEYTYLTELVGGYIYTKPPLATVNNGLLTSKKLFNAAGTEVASEAITYKSLSYSTYNAGLLVYASQGLPATCNSISIIAPYFTSYRPRTKSVLMETQVSKLDGVSTSKTYTYDATLRHRNPVSITYVNSDNKTTVEAFKYTHESTSLPSGVRQCMLDRNMIGIPLENTTTVASLLVSGQRREFNFYSTSTGNIGTSCTSSNPYLWRLSNYEMSWTNGNPLTGAWVVKGTINNYHSATSTLGKGYPKQYTATNWPVESYEWHNGQIKKRTYLTYNWLYNYYTNTSLLQSIVEVDGQTSSFTYDKLFRLKTASSRGGNVLTTYTYNYIGGGQTYNNVRSLTTYTAVSGSGLTQRETVQYLDGLARPMQEVRVKHRPAKGANGITQSTVDVVINQEYDSQGRLFKTTNPYLSTSTTGGYYAAPGGTPFTTYAYEASPLNRQSSVTAPNGYVTSTVYGKNTSTITLPGTSLSYGANTLNETKITDPDNRVVFAYTDKKGRSVYTKRTNTSNTSPAHTYYQYDDKDRLEKVIPPSASATSTELIFTYTYSANDLVTAKKVPGMAVQNLKYNNRDQLTFFQDGNLLAQNKSLGTKYDDYGRVLEAGHVTGFPSSTSSFSFSELMHKSFYDGFDGTTQLSLTTYPQYRGKVRRTEDKLLGSTNWLYQTISYDTHARITGTTGNNHLNIGSASAESHTYTYDWDDNILTENRTHNPGTVVIGGTQTINFRRDYDLTGRNTTLFLTQAGVTTQLAEYVYSHKDEIIERNLHYNSGGGSNGWLQSVDYAYDNNMGWLTAINGNGSGGTTMALPTSGCTVSLPNPGSPAKVTYPEQNDLFYLELRYDQLFSSGSGAITGMTATTQKAGNISQVAWRVRGRDRQAYSYTYDHLSRLTNATYYDVNSSNTATATNRYNETLTYDLRGNISTLQRQGFYSSSCGYGQIDNLVYTYDAANPNRLKSIADNAPASQKSHGFNPGSGGVGYTYDANGNLKSDTYKGITNITYNHLNLPTKIEWGTTKSIEFVYDAGGNKRTKTVKTGTTVDLLLDYCNGVEYRKIGTGSERIEAIYHPEGRYFNVNAESSNTVSWRKEFTLQDHLGNSRLMFTDKNNNGIVDVTNSATTSDILQESAYYPFGLNFEGPWLQNDVARDNAYQYNAKELNADFGLNWLDYGARWYDPSVGRWMAVDPLAEDYFSLSPYNYVANNPIVNYDPNGEFIGTLIGGIAGGVIAAIRGENVWKGVVSGAIGGAVFDLAVATGGTGLAALAIAGTLSGGASNIVDQGWDIIAGNQNGFNRRELGFSMLAGGVLSIGGGVVGKFAQRAKYPNAHGTLGKVDDDAYEIIIDSQRYPESAKHIDDALAEGIKMEGVLDRGGAAARRRANTKTKETKTGMDRDEAPPAVINTGENVSVRHVTSSDNRGAGSSIGRQVKDVKDGTKVRITTTNRKNKQ